MLTVHWASPRPTFTRLHVLSNSWKGTVPCRRLRAKESFSKQSILAQAEAKGILVWAVFVLFFFSIHRSDTDTVWAGAQMQLCGNRPIGRRLSFIRKGHGFQFPLLRPPVPWHPVLVHNPISHLIQALGRHSPPPVLFSKRPTSTLIVEEAKMVHHGAKLSGSFWWTKQLIVSPVFPSSFP